MKTSHIFIILQAGLMIAAVAGTAWMMNSIKKADPLVIKSAADAYNAQSILFYIILGIHAAAITLHGLSVFWCKGN